MSGVSAYDARRTRSTTSPSVHIVLAIFCVGASLKNAASVAAKFAACSLCTNGHDSRRFEALKRFDYTRAPNICCAIANRKMAVASVGVVVYCKCAVSFESRAPCCKNKTKMFTRHFIKKYAVLHEWSPPTSDRQLQNKTSGGSCCPLARLLVCSPFLPRRQAAQ